MRKYKGISLIILVITITCIIILAGAVILSTVDNNPIGQANEAVFKSDLKVFENELNISVGNKELGGTSKSDVFAKGGSLKGLMPSIKKAPAYESILQVIEGELYLIGDAIPAGSREQTIKWAKEAGISTYERSQVPIINRFTIDFVLEDRVSVSLHTIDSISGIVDYIFYISEDNVDFRAYPYDSQTYTYSGLTLGTKYYVKGRVVDRDGNIVDSETVEVIPGTSSGSGGSGGEDGGGGGIIPSGRISFNLNPNLAQGNYTNGNVIVRINYPAIDGRVNQYSLDGNTFTNYTNTLTISENKTIYARQLDAEQFEVTSSAINVVSIDKNAPTLINVAAADITKNSIKLVINGSDNLSGVRGYRMSRDNGVTWTAEQTDNVFLINGLAENTTYTFTFKIIDNARNELTTTGYKYTTTGSAVAGAPYIPEGFEHVAGTTVENGFVIKDKIKGNEFVWVPVVSPNADFKMIEYGKGVSKGNETISSALVASVNKYKGFYRGRYEQGFGNITKKGATVWTNIPINEFLTSAANMYKTAEIATEMQYGTTWDATCNWLSTKGYNIENSRGWGNYYNSMTPANVIGYRSLQNSGYSEHWKANNIYDMAGNIWEYTQEIRSGYYVMRGGGWDTSFASDAPVTFRYIYSSQQYTNLGFSVVLYKKN